MGAIIIRTRYDEGTESAEVATSGTLMYVPTRNRASQMGTGFGLQDFQYNILALYIKVIYSGLEIIIVIIIIIIFFYQKPYLKMLIFDWRRRIMEETLFFQKKKK